MMVARMRACVGSSLVFASLASACLAFEGVEPALGGGGQASEGGGGEGVGAAPAENCLAQSPSCLLPQLEAARLCARIPECETLGAAISRSLGLPLVELDSSGVRVGFNYSACIDWLTAPLSTSLPGFEAVQRDLNCLAATSTCDKAGACLSFYPLAGGDVLCDGQSGRRCEGDRLIDCDASLATNCDGAAFPVTSRCEDGAAGSPTCRVGPCGADATSCEENPPGAEYQLVCNQGDELGLYCSLFGLACGPSGCGDALSTCGVAFEQTCLDAGTAEVCAAPRPDGSLARARFDCAAAGETCVVENFAARCTPRDAACSPYLAGSNVCDPVASSVIQLCVRGEPTSIDCASLGLSCEPEDGAGTSGRCR